jgi:hypothetical protein
MSQVSTSKLIFNNETCTNGSYNGFSILIRDKDGYISNKFSTKNKTKRK